MYYVLVFLDNEWGLYNIRALRSKGYSSLVMAKKALEKSGKEGYIKKIGLNLPVWKTKDSHEQN